MVGSINSVWHYLEEDLDDSEIFFGVGEQEVGQFDQKVGHRAVHVVG